jgi:glycine/D-amino acid oxidase-like deaminating enzyme
MTTRGQSPQTRSTRRARRPDAEIDAVIVGGGIAGLWLLNVLTARGYGAVLLEADRLGAGQTLASQGMIHGGIKYSLGGGLTPASEAIAGMPSRWVACLEGRGEVDLSRLEPASDRYYLFADGSVPGHLAAFFASRAIRGRVDRLRPDEYPPVFADPRFRGVVYALPDLVLDTEALLRALTCPVADRMYRCTLAADDVQVAGDGALVELGRHALFAKRVILTAGAGNGPLLAGLGLNSPAMQLRPLHQVIVRHAHPHPLWAHCLTGIRRPEPRLTITSHPDGDHWLWYLGGQIATEGVTRSRAALAAHARRELEQCVPWLHWRDAHIETLAVDRAEPQQSGGQRPDEAFACAQGPIIVAWPIKLSLAPDLGDRVLALMPPASRHEPPRLELPPPAVGRAPWAD